MFPNSCIKFIELERGYLRGQGGSKVKFWKFLCFNKFWLCGTRIFLRNWKLSNDLWDKTSRKLDVHVVFGHFPTWSNKIAIKFYPKMKSAQLFRENMAKWVIIKVKRSKTVRILPSFRPRHDGTKPGGVEEAKFGSERLLTIASWDHRTNGSTVIFPVFHISMHNPFTLIRSSSATHPQYAEWRHPGPSSSQGTLVLHLLRGPYLDIFWIQFSPWWFQLFPFHFWQSLPWRSNPSNRKK